MGWDDYDDNGIIMMIIAGIIVMNGVIIIIDGLINGVIMGFL